VASDSRCASRIFEIIQHLLEFSKRASVVKGNPGEVGKGQLQPSKQAAYRRKYLAAASDEPVDPISQPAASKVTRGRARPLESAKSGGANERGTAHFNWLADTDWQLRIAPSTKIARTSAGFS
jgi:hypothetical protein